MNNSYQILSVNGEYLSSLNYNVDRNSRAFRYGDGFFETMHANGQKVQFLDDHFSRLQTAAEVLSIELPDNFTIDYLQTHIAGLLHRCRLYQGVKVRIIVSRSEGGLYIPKNNNAQILIEAEYLSEGKYELNKDGIVVGVYNEPLYATPICAFKTLNALPYIIAGVYASKNNYDDVLLINKDSYIVEATSSNLFCFKDKVLYTPALKLGAVHGVMRKNIIVVAQKMGFEVKSESLLTEHNLLEMDELFLTNAVSGIRWIAGLGKRRYFKRYSAKILRELNKQEFH